jgi:hypothetical protein
LQRDNVLFTSATWKKSADVGSHKGNGAVIEHLNQEPFIIKVKDQQGGNNWVYADKPL